MVELDGDTQIRGDSLPVVESTGPLCGSGWERADAGHDDFTNERIHLIVGGK